MRIYIASPYSAPTPEAREQNARRAIAVGALLLQKGHQPYIPHLTHFVDLEATWLGLHFTWDDYMELDIEWLHQCQALLYLGSSRGADMELELATNLGLTIYRDLQEVPEAPRLGKRHLPAS